MSQAGILNPNGTGAGAVETLTGNSGGAVGPDGSHNINIVGSGGINVAGNPGTHTLTITSSATPFTWNDVTMSSTTMAVNNGYTANDGATLVTLTLPNTAVYGSVIAVVGKATGLWTIAQNAGQTIHIGKLNTTTGAGGSLSSTGQYDVVYLLCTIADTDFTVTTTIGNLTVV